MVSIGKAAVLRLIVDKQPKGMIVNNQRDGSQGYYYIIREGCLSTEVS